MASSGRREGRDIQSIKSIDLTLIICWIDVASTAIVGWKPDGARWSQLVTLIPASNAAEPLNHAARAPSAAQRWPGRGVHTILPGLLLTSLVAGTSFAIRMLPGMTTFSPPILSVVIGIAYHNTPATAALAQQRVT